MEQNMENRVYIKFPAITENERTARMMAAAFLTGLNPTVEEMDDVKTAVSEAVTNSIIHAYEDRKKKEECLVEVEFIRKGQRIEIIIIDYGKGIEDVKKAMEPLYTTKPKEERSGMGFSFMEAFMDELEVISVKGEGTRVIMKKMIGNRKD
ncbi:MAG: anti-sigma F factor [Lachnospiraceae bacterium]|nr:anti-sigma F factor [Lachnospiraceae bacterium]